MTVVIDWDVTVFLHRVAKTTNLKAGDPDAPSLPQPEQDAIDKFLGSHRRLGYFDIPTILLDNDGRIVCWFLPDLIDPSRVVGLDLICQWTILLTSDCSLIPKQWVNEAIVGLNSILLKGQAKDDKSNKSNWRTNDVFRKPSQANLFTPGCVDFSPAWFAQGHDAVSVI